MTESTTPADSAFDLYDDTDLRPGSYDTNADGIADTTVSDLDADGVADSIGFDLDQDGDLDQVAYLDESGDVDRLVLDQQDDGFFTPVGDDPMEQDTFTPTDDVTNADVDTAMSDLEHTNAMSGLMTDAGVIDLYGA